MQRFLLDFSGFQEADDGDTTHYGGLVVVVNKDTGERIELEAKGTDRDSMSINDQVLDVIAAACKPELESFKAKRGEGDYDELTDILANTIGEAANTQEQKLIVEVDLDQEKLDDCIQWYAPRQVILRRVIVVALDAEEPDVTEAQIGAATSQIKKAFDLMSEKFVEFVPAPFKVEVLE